MKRGLIPKRSAATSAGPGTFAAASFVLVLYAAVLLLGVPGAGAAEASDFHDAEVASVIQVAGAAGYRAKVADSAEGAAMGTAPPPVDATEDGADTEPVGESEAAVVEQDTDIDAGPDSASRAAETAHEFVRTSQELWRTGAIDDAVDALDRAYELLLSISDGEDPVADRQKADLRNLIARRLVENQAARRTSSGDLSGSIPLTVNPAVEREIRSFQGPERDFFLSSWLRSGRHRPMILEELRAAGLPDQLSWLPLIESGFKTQALSSARALGLWQFIPSTGWRFGLERDTWKDERMDPTKATRAAIAYLTELHGLFGDWLTALAGYNCGENAVLRLINAQKIGWLDQFWDLNARLPNETARYVPRFIATLLIVSEPGKYGFELPEPASPVGVEVVETERRMRLADIDMAMGLVVGTLAELNPELRLGLTPDEAYPLKVPSGAGANVVAQLLSVSEYSAAGAGAVSGAAVAKRPVIRQKTKYRSRSPILIHAVRRGENLTRIAANYRTTVAQIRKDNRIRGSRLLVGQNLVIRAWSAGTARIASRER